MNGVLDRLARTLRSEEFSEAAEFSEATELPETVEESESAEPEA